jgi:hypothetical protein
MSGARVVRARDTFCRFAVGARITRDEGRPDAQIDLDGLTQRSAYCSKFRLDMKPIVRERPNYNNTDQARYEPVFNGRSTRRATNKTSNPDPHGRSPPTTIATTRKRSTQTVGQKGVRLD